MVVQRALQGSHKFGLCPAGGLLRCQPLYGTKVEIVECESLPGGRYYLEVVGVQIFRINDYFLQQIQIGIIYLMKKKTGSVCAV
eukprot:snap_masked-scaffold_44-processed-gene-1.41-mRNA-1 protein AED:1.00 eAED:1.00 QI:0/0/0/0/1/1/2/0/83